jgi:hypothetical protein
VEIAQLLHPETSAGGNSDSASAMTDAAALGNGVDAIAVLISRGEGTDGAHGYDKVYGPPKRTWYPPNAKKPSELTIDQWIAMGPSLVHANGSSAMGKFQITTAALKDLMGRMNLNGDEVMTPELQNRMMRQLLSKAHYDDFLTDRDTGARPKVQKALAGIWSSVAPDSSDVTHPKGKSGPARKAAISTSDIQSALTAAKATYDANVQRRLEDGYLPPSVGDWR